LHVFFVVFSFSSTHFRLFMSETEEFTPRFSRKRVKYHLNTQKPGLLRRSFCFSDKNFRKNTEVFPSEQKTSTH